MDIHPSRYEYIRVKDIAQSFPANDVTIQDGNVYFIVYRFLVSVVFCDMIDEIEDDRRYLPGILFFQFPHYHLQRIDYLFVEIPEYDIILEIGDYEIADKILKPEKSRHISLS